MQQVTASEYSNQQPEQQPAVPRNRLKRRPRSVKKKLSKKRAEQATDSRNSREWNDRFFVTTSTYNQSLHQFYREYFDKKPKEYATSFRIKYANSTNELPGISDVCKPSHSKVKNFKSYAEQPHTNVTKLINETRMPIKKGQSRAFPSAKKHFQMAQAWQNDFIVMQSRANEHVYK